MIKQRNDRKKQKRRKEKKKKKEKNEGENCEADDQQSIWRGKVQGKQFAAMRNAGASDHCTVCTSAVDSTCNTPPSLALQAGRPDKEAKEGLSAEHCQPDSWYRTKACLLLPASGAVGTAPRLVSCCRLVGQLVHHQGTVSLSLSPCSQYRL